jgi:hypothetical protein
VRPTVVEGGGALLGRHEIRSARITPGTKSVHFFAAPLFQESNGSAACARASPAVQPNKPMTRSTDENVSDANAVDIAVPAPARRAGAACGER